MKAQTKIFLFLLIAFFCNCHSKEKRIETSNNEATEAKPELVKSVKLAGKYYVDDFYRHSKTGFELKAKKPEDSFILYTFEFKKNGALVFDDLTEFYGCGNGVLSIKKAKWRLKSLFKLPLIGCNWQI